MKKRTTVHGVHSKENSAKKSVKINFIHKNTKNIILSFRVLLGIKIYIIIPSPQNATKAKQTIFMKNIYELPHSFKPHQKIK